MSSFSQVRQSLYWRISGLFLAIFILLGIAYVLVTISLAKKYSDETTQKLHSNVASHMLRHVKPFVDGSVNQKSLETIMNSMMAVNPSLEVYLLDPSGKILSYVVLHKKARSTKVSMDPIRKFIASGGQALVYGDDPRNPGKLKIFSASEVRENGKLQGYVYMVLASEEYENIALALQDSYFLRIGIWTFILTLLAAFLIGLAALWLLMRSLRGIINTVRKFASGDLNPRIEINSSGELVELAATINTMADTLVHSMNELKEIDKLRRDLIANISHDIRTPLSIIHGYVETLSLKQNHIDEAKQAEYVQTILKGTEKLKHLVDDLFELSKLESRQFKPKMEAFFVADLLLDLGNKYKLKIQDKKQSLQISISPQLPTALADVALIERVLQNLLDNAINHCPENGSIEIRAESIKGKLIVSVSNSGSGIPPDELPKIFNRYYKTADSQGTGLGLAIVKNILDIHSTNVLVENELPRGVTFSFELPVAIGELHANPLF